MYSLKTKIFTHVFRFKCNQGWGQSNSGIGIAAQYELELKLVELKMELELKSLELELELKTGIELFATATEALTSLPTISKFSFNRGGHNLSCG